MIGSGLDVWEIVHMLDDFGAVEALVAATALSMPQVRLAVAYREEIDEAIAENRRPVADVGLLFPFIAVANR